MSDKPMSKPEETEESAAPDEAAEPAAESAAAPEATEALAEETPAEEKEAAADPADPSDDPRPDAVAALQAEVADLKDRLLRAAAEMENMRRRFEREMADARQYAVTGFAREVLSIGDNLHRALAAVPQEAREEGGAMKGLVEGVEMTEHELLRVLDKHGVKRLDPEGTKFDPNFHQAMFEVEHDDHDAHGKVVQVMQHGYSIGDRVLRPALVGVAKAKPGKAPEAEADDTAAADGPAQEENAAPAEPASGSEPEAKQGN